MYIATALVTLWGLLPTQHAETLSARYHAVIGGRVAEDLSWSEFLHSSRSWYWELFWLVFFEIIRVLPLVETRTGWLVSETRLRYIEILPAFMKIRRKSGLSAVVLWLRLATRIEFEDDSWNWSLFWKLTVVVGYDGTSKEDIFNVRYMAEHRKSWQISELALVHSLH
jgi:hypothetical protein